MLAEARFRKAVWAADHNEAAIHPDLRMIAALRAGEGEVPLLRLARMTVGENGNGVIAGVARGTGQRITHFNPLS